MINDILAVISFCTFIVELMFRTDFLPRLLGVNSLVATIWQQKIL